jgi:hypothetical protein
MPWSERRLKALYSSNDFCQSYYRGCAFGVWKKSKQISTSIGILMKQQSHSIPALSHLLVLVYFPWHTGHSGDTCAGVLSRVMRRLRRETIIPSLDAQEASEAAAQADAQAQEAVAVGELRPAAVLENCMCHPPRPLGAKLASEIGAAVERAHVTSALIDGETDSDEGEGEEECETPPVGRT